MPPSYVELCLVELFESQDLLRKFHKLEELRRREQERRDFEDAL